MSDEDLERLVSHATKYWERFDFVLEIDSFIADKKRTEMSFPSTLTSGVRKIIHEISEERNLIHESVGEGRGRHIQLRKNIAYNPSSKQLEGQVSGKGTKRKDHHSCQSSQALKKKKK